MTQQRNLRGGSYYTDAGSTSARAYAHPQGWSRLYGFRVVVRRKR